MTAKNILIWLLALACSILPARELSAAFHVPFQKPAAGPECTARGGSSGDGYFRPEYAELVQRLDPEVMGWLIRTYPILGWQGMDPRVYTPKPVPGSGREPGFQYSTTQRHLQLEALFHFGPLGGNGTLIEDLVELDANRLLTVNRGSRNLSVIDTGKPDVTAVIPTPNWLESLEINRASQELYLVERRALGLLVWSLRNYSLTDTLFTGFHPDAVLLSSDNRFLYLSNEEGGELVRYDLSQAGAAPARAECRLKAPWFMAEDAGSGILVMVSRADGALELFDPAGFHGQDPGLSLGGPLLAWCAPKEADGMFLASGDCERSRVFRLSIGEGKAALDPVAAVGGPVSALGVDDKAGVLCAVSGRDLYSLDPTGGKTGLQCSLPVDLRRVLPVGSRIYVTGGLEDLYVLDSDLQGKPRRVTVEMGPGPLVARKGAIWVANGLSSSLTVIDADKLSEDVSVLVGVLLGRMVYHDHRIVVNNVFRGNVMVLDPEAYVIEDIVPVGGSLHYSPAARRVTMFDDSLVVGMDYPPSRVSIYSTLDMPYGVRLFAQTVDPMSFIVADQRRAVLRIDLNKRFRYGDVPLPEDCTGLFVLDNNAWVLTDYSLCRLGVTETVGLSQRYSLRPFKFAPPYIATDYTSNYSGSQIHLISRDQVLDMTSTPGGINVIRADPDTTLSYFGTTRNIKVYDSRNSQELSTIPRDGQTTDIYLPTGSLQGYAVGGGKLTVFDRQTYFERDELDLDAGFVYANGDDLFLGDRSEPRTLYVVDGYRGSLFQTLTLPVSPTDAAADPDRLYLLGGTEGAIAIYVNLIATERLPRSPDRSVWDTQADRRSGTHR